MSNSVTTHHHTTTLSDEEERAAFELACDSQFLGISRHPELPEQYQSWDMQCRWIGWQAAKADERTRSKEAVEGDRMENAEKAIMACPISTKDWNYAQPIAARVLEADDEWRAAHPQPSSEEPSEQDIERATANHVVPDEKAAESAYKESASAITRTEVNAIIMSYLRYLEKRNVQTAILSYLKKD